MTTMEAFITADILLTKRGADGAEERASELLAEAQAHGDAGRAEEWARVRQALEQMVWTDRAA